MSMNQETLNEWVDKATKEGFKIQEIVIKIKEICENKEYGGEFSIEPNFGDFDLLLLCMRLCGETEVSQSAVSGKKRLYCKTRYSKVVSVAVKILDGNLKNNLKLTNEKLKNILEKNNLYQPPFFSFEVLEAVLRENNIPEFKIKKIIQDLYNSEEEND